MFTGSGFLQISDGTGTPAFTPPFTAGGDPWSICCDFETDGRAPINFYMSWGSGANTAVFIGDDGLVGTIGNGAANFGAFPWLATGPHRVLATYDGTTLLVYVDGVLADTILFGVGIVLNGFAQIANFTSGLNAVVKLANVGWWDEVISPADAVAYTAGGAVAAVLPLAGGAVTFLPLHADYADISGNGNDGVPDGTPPSFGLFSP